NRDGSKSRARQITTNTAIPTARDSPPYCTTTIDVQYTIPRDEMAPVTYPRRNPWAGLGASRRATISGASASQATAPCPNFGKERARRTPERAARPSLRACCPVEDLV